MSFRIFITEDDKVTALFISQTLKKVGYEVEGIAYDGESAISQMENLSPDLVLMDISLPGELDGIVTAEIIKKRYNIPVIYATASSDEETLQRVLSSDPNGYVLKPIIPVQLYTTIETTMHRYRLVEQLKVLNEQLEDKVDERTKELAKNNRLLQAEVERRRAVETNLKQSLAKEKELNELKTRIVSIVSHEFKTPLTTILSSAQLIDYHIKKNAPPDKLTHHTSTIVRSVKSLTAILNDTLFMTKTESLDFQIEPKHCSIANIIKDTWEDLKIGIVAHHKLDLKIADNVPETIFQDEKLLKQALLNLLTNAVKYSQQADTVTVKASHIDENIQLSVTDYGMGIPKKDFKHLFEMFHRASNVDNIEGTGIGLAIVKKTMYLLGGEVTCSSVESEGATFTLSFPINYTFHNPF